MMDEPSIEATTNAYQTAVGQAVLTEAVRHGDIIHTSLVGMTAIVMLLVGALSLPLWGLAPVTESLSLHVIILTAFSAICVLYYMNYTVHDHVARQAALTEVLVNSLGQGFLTFDRSGLCGGVYSQSCLDLLECVPADRKIAEVLHIPEASLSDFLDWVDVLFLPNHALGFDDVSRFLPQFYQHSQGRRVRLMYRPIRDREGVLLRVVLIATDQTEEYRAQQQAKEKQALADMIARVFKDRNQFYVTLNFLRSFLVDANRPDVSLADSPSIMRHLHTLKAAVRHFGLLRMGDLAHQLETDLRSPGINTDRQFRQQLLAGRQGLSMELDRILSEFRELIGTEYEWNGVVREVDESTLFAFAQQMQTLGISHTVVRGYLSQIVAVPVQDCFRSFERELQGLVESMSKRMKPIIFEGSNPKVLTLPLQDFFFSLTHLSRNIADHAIEAPTLRASLGKDMSGQVTISATVETDPAGAEILHLVVRDDGHGIDPQRVREKLSVVDPEGAWRNENDSLVIQNIFRSGFSTRDSVSDISGRGVGMDAIAFEVHKLGGQISVSSVLGKGTSFDIRLPYLMDLSFMSQRQGSETVYGAPVVESGNTL